MLRCPKSMYSISILLYLHLITQEMEVVLIYIMIIDIETIACFIYTIGRIGQNDVVNEDRRL